MKVAITVSLTEKQAVFETTIENHSDLMVENVYSPYLGDIQHPRDEAWFKTFIFSYATVQSGRCGPRIQNLRGYYGVDYPTQQDGRRRAARPL